MKLKSWLFAAEMAAFISILSQFVLPLGVIPLTGQTFAVGLTGSLFSKKVSGAAILIYLLLGLMGLPVFAGGKGGLSILAGPTAGFLIGFFLQAIFTSWYLGKRKPRFSYYLLGNVLGGMLTLVAGSCWLSFFFSFSLPKAFATGFIGFFIPTLINCLLAGWLGFLLKKRLKFTI